ncbi:MAG: DUF1015 domain-containing protein [Ruminococcaceae bacterium]|nr:DUF1015 domain-containing protein [Oscillospiraceae bacterium]
MNDRIFRRGDILLPRNLTKEALLPWSVVACDQYTSDPAYWDAVEEIVGDAPSTRRITYPELYLNAPDKDARIAAIAAATREYREQVLETYPEAMIYVERTMKNGKIRCGIVGTFDLEAYSYEKDSQTPIRATEGTVLSRIPPRVQIRRDAAVETPHVMILCDDKEKKLFSAAAQAKTAAPLYDFDLMQGGGHITGWLIAGTLAEEIEALAVSLGDADTFADRYHADGKMPLVFPVGDGNHSLATAKACWEACKAAGAPDTHPARFALAELVNLHDDALEFEPIYRVVFGADGDALLADMKAYYPALTDGICDGHTFEVIFGTQTRTVTHPHPAAQLPVGTLQTFLDAWLAGHPEAEVDYIHGIEATKKLAQGEHAVGFLFDGMEKDDLFRTVIFDGALPRKTFSMGEADEKRYYLECRAIR